MGINYRKRILIQQTSIHFCEECKKVYAKDDNFCPHCGKKLKIKNAKLFANMGKNGITSYSYVTADGITINSKSGNVTIPIGNGISFTSK